MAAAMIDATRAEPDAAAVPAAIAVLDDFMAALKARSSFAG
jgi:hypothetical protein